MKILLGVDYHLSPKDCYSYWKKNVNKEHLTTIDKMVSEMQNSDKVIQAEYLWNHPKKGEILVRSSGRCAKNSDNILLFEGFHRIINDL